MDMLMGTPWSITLAGKETDVGCGSAEVLECSGEAGRRRLSDTARAKEALCWVSGEL